jgi:predicted ferric reductase
MQSTLHRLTATKAFHLSPTKDSTMKAMHCFLSILSALLILLHCLSITLAPSQDREITRNKFQPRRMLRAIDTSTIDMKNFQDLADKKSQIEVNASLRRMPSSNANPAHN